MRGRLFLQIAGSGLIATAAAGVADATNYPCSQKKGGIKQCLGEKFLCNDGTTSASKKNCETFMSGRYESGRPPDGEEVAEDAADPPPQSRERR